MRPLLLALSLAVALAALPHPARAQPAPPALQILPGPEGVRLRLASAGPALAGATPPAPATTALLLPPDGDAAPRLVAEERVPWLGPLPTRALPARFLPDGTRYEPLAAFAPAQPAAPVELLYETRLRGRRIGVYALNQVYAADGGAYLASSIEALVPGAVPLDDPTALAELDPDAPFLAEIPAGPAPLAAQPGWTIRVTRGGVQVLSAAALRAAGLDPARPDLAKLRLTLAGREVAMEEVRAGGSIAELRFYALPPSSRWDPADIYRLTLGDAPGLRFSSAEALPRGGELSRSALSRGAWYAPKSYASQIAGPDGDHFFSADLRVAPLPSTTPATATVTLAPGLPLADGEALLTISGASLYAGPRTLRATMAGATRSATWSGGAVFSHTLRFPAGATAASLAIPPAAAIDGALIDRVAWDLPVSLSFGGKGAQFYGRPGHWAYELSGLPAGAALYDVSDPARPRRLAGQRVSPGVLRFEDEGQEDGERAYVVAGLGTLQAPAIAAHTPADLSKPLNAAALYIAPRAWLATLEPLLARRRAEGLKVAAVPVEAIYAGWSGDAVSPPAIRAFLRYAAATWATKPTAVTLVGDGTSDPYNYFGTGWTSWIPPYLLPVDPWIGETACESCYAQLDGASPLDDLLPDLAIGRLPAKSAEELAALLRKILAYETDRSPGRWRARVAYVADDKDYAGDFAAVAQASAARQPRGVQVANLFYDPQAPALDPNRERDAVRALERAIGAFNSGAGALVYYGHGLQYQWAVTGPPAAPAQRYLLNVDTARSPQNGTRLPVVLSMTCLAGAFQTPGFRGTTLDEALVVYPNGGSIATWGSAGFGVLYGHESLTAGFFDALWKDPARARLGALTLAGYARLAADGSDAASLRTFALLGDAHTPLRMIPDAASVREVSLPTLGR